MKLIFLLILVSSSILTIGCVGHLDGQTYDRDQARRVQQIQYGVIRDITPVVLEGTQSHVGSIAGAIVGGLAGSAIGKGRGSTIAAVVGAVAGGVAGNAAEEKLTRSQGMEFIIRLDSGNTIAIVQEHNPNADFLVGDHIKIISVDGESRISPSH